MWALSSQCCLPGWECKDLSDLSDPDDIREPLITSSCCSQTHSLGKVMGTKTMEAFGPSDIYCSLDPSGANVVMVDGWSHHPQRYPL